MPSIAKATARSVAGRLTELKPARNVLRRAAMRGYLPYGVWRRLPVHGQFEVKGFENSTFKYFSTERDGIGRRLYWRGLEEFEGETSRVFWAFARNAKLTVDVGANTGLYSILAGKANQDAHVISIEPVPRVFERLKENIEINDLGDRSILLHVAASDFDGESKLHVPNHEVPLSASLSPDGFRGYSGALVDVEVARLDSVIDNLRAVDMVKIDVEGHEDKVLRGMQRILAEASPAVFLECFADGPVTEVMTLLTGRGYRLYRLLPDGPMPVNDIFQDEISKFSNYLAIGERTDHRSLIERWLH